MVASKRFWHRFAIFRVSEDAWDAGGARGQDAGGDAGRERNGEFFVAHFAAFFGALNPYSPMSL